MSGRNRRGHLSKKVSGVVLRPAPAPAAGAGPSSARASRDRTASPDNLMDRERIRQLYAEDEGERGPEDTAHDRDPRLSQRPFAGLTVCFTGLSTRKQGLADMLRSMGVGVIEANLKADVDVLVADECGSAKYLSALEYGIQIAVPEWIEELHAQWVRGEEVDPREALAEYKLPAFAGLKMVISGFEPLTRRQEIQSLVLEHGGIYSKNLDRTCTHLVLAAPLPDAPYTPSPKTAWAINQRPDLHPSAGAAAGGAAPPEGYIHVVWEGWFFDCVAFGGRWEEKRWDARLGGLGPGPGESMRERVAARKAAEAEATARLEAELATDLATVKSFDPLAGASDVELQPAMIRRAKTNDLMDELFRNLRRRPGTGEGVEAVLAPATGAVVERAADGAARKRPRLALVGSQESDAPRSVLHTSRVHAFETAANLDKPAAPPQPQPAKTASRRSFADEAAKLDSMALTATLFAGLTFSHVTSDSVVLLELALRRLGAQLFTESERLQGARVDYVITRLASGKRPYISPKSHTQVVTECWVERCMNENRIFPIDESIVFRPLTAPMPIPGAEKLRIHLSGLTPELTYYSQRLVKAIGASIAPALHKRDTTHLLCSTINRVKFDRAQQWGLPTLQLDWLYDTASTGSIAPVQDYIITAQTAAKLSDTANPIFAPGRLPLTGTRTVPAEGGDIIAASQQDENSQRATSQRKLGLTPTEVDLGSKKAVHGSDGSQGLSNAGLATERLLNQVAPATRELTKTVSVPSNPFKVVSEEKRTSVPLLTSEIMQKLDMEAEQAVDRRTRRIRRPRPLAQRKHSDSHSILAPRDPSEYEASIEPAAEDADAEEQSIRVTYNDPVAEKERKRIMDAIVRPHSAASTASSRSKKRKS